MNGSGIDRSLLDRARAEMEPTTAQRERLLARTTMAVAGMAAAGATAAKAAAAAPTAQSATVVAGAAGAWKFALVVATGVLVAAGASWQLAGTSDESAPVSPASTSSASVRRPSGLSSNDTVGAMASDPSSAETPVRHVAQPVERALISPPAEITHQPVSLDQARELRRARRERPSVTRAPHVASGQAPPRTVPPAIPETRLLDETRLLGDAHRALSAGQPLMALALLDRHREEFPVGAMRQERAATRVLALCAAGRDADARRAGQRFLSVYPNSMQAPRIRASCGGPVGGATQELSAP